MIKTKRSNIAKQAQQILVDDVADIYCCIQVQTVVSTTKVKNVPVHPIDYYLLTRILLLNKSDCIVFDKVTISYGTEQAVRDVSFSVPNGEVFAIVGESGSGKSTLVRAAFGMLKQASISGQILLNGTDVSTLSDGDWRQLRGTKISMIFQNPSAYLNPNRTVEITSRICSGAHDESYVCQVAL